MGSITESASHQFAICPAGQASETMAGIQQGAYASLDAALAEIQKHTPGASAGAILRFGLISGDPNSVFRHGHERISTFLSTRRIYIAERIGALG